jgi:DNA-directed RNA polymerase subunit RPC12/RpoP
MLLPFAQCWPVRCAKCGHTGTISAAVADLAAKQLRCGSCGYRQPLRARYDRPRTASPEWTPGKSRPAGGCCQIPKLWAFAIRHRHAERSARRSSFRWITTGEEYPMTLLRTELRAAAAEIIKGDIKGKSLQEITHLMTVTQYVTNLCLNEIEDRGQLVLYMGNVVVPYECDYVLETALTRTQH